MHQRLSPLAGCLRQPALTVNLQHGGGLRLAHAVLRRARVRALVLLFHPEQPKDVAVVDLEPGS